MKAKAERITLAYEILQSAKLGKLDNKEKIEVLKVANKLKPVATALIDFRKDAIERLKPDGFDEISNKVAMGGRLTPAESLIFNQVDKSVGECVKEVGEKEHEIKFTALKDSLLGKVFESNDYTVGQMIALQEIIGE